VKPSTFQCGSFVRVWKPVVHQKGQNKFTQPVKISEQRVLLPSDSLMGKCGMQFIKHLQFRPQMDLLLEVQQVLRTVGYIVLSNKCLRKYLPQVFVVGLDIVEPLNG